MFIKEKKEKAPKEMRLERDPHTLPECVKSRSACGALTAAPGCSLTNSSQTYRSVERRSHRGE